MDGDRVLELVVWGAVFLETALAFTFRFDGWLLALGAGLTVGLLSLFRGVFNRVSKRWDFLIALFGPPLTMIVVGYLAHLDWRWAVAMVAGLATPQALLFTWRLETAGYSRA